VLTIPCDTPFLPADFADRLRGGLEPHHSAAVAASAGMLHPSCALWRTRAFDALGLYLASGRASLRGFAEDIGFVQVNWPVETKDPFFNINSPTDLAAAEAHGRF
jgi:molybdopterin-guanine dinucleotide biosynthesis protein A